MEYLSLLEEDGRLVVRIGEAILDIQYQPEAWIERPDQTGVWEGLTLEEGDEEDLTTSDDPDIWDLRVYAKTHYHDVYSLTLEDTGQFYGWLTVDRAPRRG